MRAWLSPVILAAATAFGCSSSTTCGPSTCTGCCDTNGFCQSPSAQSCGQGGAACQVCSGVEACVNGACGFAPGNGANSGGNNTGSNGPSTSSSVSSSGSSSTTGGSSGSTSASATASGTGSSGSPSSTTTSTTTTTTSASSSSTSSTGTTGANSPPVIASLSANPTDIHEQGSTTISAVVTDPDGLSDLAGGTLTDDLSGTTYGAFSTPGGQGTFTYELSWSAMNSASPINSGPGGTTRTVTAQFFDNHGHTVSQSLTLTLSCSSSGDSICDGTCVDLQSDLSNCGSCGHVCTAVAQSSPTCSAGTCNYAFMSNFGAAPESCTALCGQYGLSCAANQDCTNSSGTGTDGDCALYLGCNSPQAFSCSQVPGATLTCGSATGQFGAQTCHCS